MIFYRSYIDSEPAKYSVNMSLNMKNLANKLCMDNCMQLQP